MVPFEKFTIMWSLPTKFLRKLIFFQRAIFQPETPSQFLSISTDPTKPEPLLWCKPDEVLLDEEFALLWSGAFWQQQELWGILESIFQRPAIIVFPASARGQEGICVSWMYLWGKKMFFGGDHFSGKH